MGPSTNVLPPHFQYSIDMKPSNGPNHQWIPPGVNALASQNSEVQGLFERRLKPRILCEYPAVVRGQDGQGKKFEDAATLVNLSRTGLYLLVQGAYAQGDQVVVTITLTNPTLEMDPPRLTASGTIVRTEPQPDERVGLAIQIQHFRFL